MNGLDRAVRAVAATILGAIVLSGMITGTMSTLLIVVAVVLFGTTVTGFCPIYRVLHIGTRRATS